jgi:hypothetical protein
MDERKPGAFRRRRTAIIPSLDALEGRRLLSATPPHVSFLEGSLNGTPVLYVEGTSHADGIAITDNGTAVPGNITVTTGDGSIYTTQTAISVIEVDTKGGNDEVAYTLTGNLVTTRTIQVRLGRGNADFTANVNGNITSSGVLNLDGYGGSGNQSMTVNQTGSVAGTFFPTLNGGRGTNNLTYNGTGDILAGGYIAPEISGGTGNNTLTSSYAGKVDGNYGDSLAIKGGTGNNVITDNIQVGPNSTGTIGTSSSRPAVVEGGRGTNRIHFAVIGDPSATQVHVFAEVMGGRGRNIVEQTPDVKTVNVGKSDTVLS